MKEKYESLSLATLKDLAKARDVNIVINSSFLRRKADASCDNCYHRSHQLNKRFGMIPGRHSFPFVSGGIIAHYKSGGKKKL